MCGEVHSVFSSALCSGILVEQAARPEQPVCRPRGVLGLPGPGGVWRGSPRLFRNVAVARIRNPGNQTECHPGNKYDRALRLEMLMH